MFLCFTDNFVDSLSTSTSQTNNVDFSFVVSSSHNLSQYQQHCCNTSTVNHHIEKHIGCAKVLPNNGPEQSSEFTFRNSGNEDGKPSLVCLASGRSTPAGISTNILENNNIASSVNMVFPPETDNKPVNSTAALASQPEGSLGLPVPCDSNGYNGGVQSIDKVDAATPSSVTSSGSVQSKVFTVRNSGNPDVKPLVRLSSGSSTPGGISTNILQNNNISASVNNKPLNSTAALASQPDGSPGLPVPCDCTDYSNGVQSALKLAAATASSVTTSSSIESRVFTSRKSNSEDGKPSRYLVSGNSTAGGNSTNNLAYRNIAPSLNMVFPRETGNTAANSTAALVSQPPGLPCNSSGYSNGVQSTVKLVLAIPSSATSSGSMQSNVFQVGNSGNAAVPSLVYVTPGSSTPGVQPMVKIAPAIPSSVTSNGSMQSNVLTVKNSGNAVVPPLIYVARGSSTLGVQSTAKIAPAIPHRVTSSGSEQNNLLPVRNSGNTDVTPLAYLGPGSSAPGLQSAVKLVPATPSTVTSNGSMQSNVLPVRNSGNTDVTPLVYLGPGSSTPCLQSGVKLVPAIPHRITSSGLEQSNLLPVRNSGNTDVTPLAYLGPGSSAPSLQSAVQLVPAIPSTVTSNGSMQSNVLLVRNSGNADGKPLVYVAPVSSAPGLQSAVKLVPAIPSIVTFNGSMQSNILPVRNSGNADVKPLVYRGPGSSTPGVQSIVKIVPAIPNYVTTCSTAQSSVFTLGNSGNADVTPLVCLDPESSTPGVKSTAAIAPAIPHNVATSGSMQSNVFAVRNSGNADGRPLDYSGAASPTAGAQSTVKIAPVIPSSVTSNGSFQSNVFAVGNSGNAAVPPLVYLAPGSSTPDVQSAVKTAPAISSSPGSVTSPVDGVLQGSKHGNQPQYCGNNPQYTEPVRYISVFRESSPLLSYCHNIQPEDKPYKCNKCSVRFRTEEDFNRHLPLHYKNCPYCSEVFKSNAPYRELLKHVVMCHKDQDPCSLAHKSTVESALRGM